MRAAVFSARHYDRQFLDAANNGTHELVYFDARLTVRTAPLSRGFDAICAFVNDDLGTRVVEDLSELGVRLIAFRCTGFNNVDLTATRRLGIAVGRVPAYSPHAVAEHTFALLLTLVRKTHRAYNRVRECNFSLDGLLGFDFVTKTIGIVGTGAIGSIVAHIARGFGMQVLASDPLPRPELQSAGITYRPLDQLLSKSDIVTLHCPLDDSTRHMINAAALKRMKPDAILINTSRGAVIDTRAVIGALKRNRLAGLAIDVYEEEAGLFFEDRSSEPVLDDLFARLLTFPNVLITGHQGFFTREALTKIAQATIGNLDEFERTGIPLHPVPDRPMAIVAGAECEAAHAGPVQ